MIALKRRNFRWLLLGLFGIAIFFAKATLICLYGNCLPYGDQWAGELGFVAKFRAGDLELADFFAAHNEHRIALQRFLWLGLYGLNEWQADNFVNQYVMAGIAATSATLLMGVILWLTQWRQWIPFLCVGALLAGLPFSWENILWGFQFQFHLQVLMAMSAFVGLTLCQYLSVGWWLGVLALVAGLFTGATGFFAAAPVLLNVFLRWYDSRGLTRKEIVNAVAAFLTIVVGLALTVEASHHASLKAANASDFITALAKHLAWPFISHFAPNSFYWGWVIYTPLLFVGALTLLRKMPLPMLREAEFLLGVGGYCFLQYVAIAYGRGANGLGPPPRNFEFHLLGLATAVVSLCLCWRLASRWKPSIPQRCFRVLCGFAGATMIAGAVLNIANTFGFWLPLYTEEAKTRANLIRNYLVNGDPSIFQGRQRLEELPDPDVEKNAKHLSDPAILDLLPAPARLPKPLVPAQEGTGFDLNVELPESFARRGRPIDPYISSYAEEGREGKYLSPEFFVNRSHAIFWYAGYKTSNSLSLSFAAQEGPAQAVKIHSHEKNGRVFWTPVAVSVPGNRMRMSALDKRPKGWMAFTAPAEAGRVSAWLIQIRPMVLPAASVAIGLFVFVLLGLYVGGVRLESQSESVL